MPPRAQPPLWRSPTHKPRAHRQEQTATPAASSSSSKTKGKGKTTASGSKGKSKPNAASAGTSARVTRSQSRSASQTPHSPLNSFSQLAPSSNNGNLSSTSNNHHQHQDAHELDTDIQSHLAQISRHRVAWTRPKTPPSYWDIGFPNTQQVGGINERAREMREEGEREVRREAEGDSKEGRWRRRGG